MFGLSLGPITIIVLVGVLVLGPERIPPAVSWVPPGARHVRTTASGAPPRLVAVERVDNSGLRHPIMALSGGTTAMNRRSGQDSIA